MINTIITPRWDSFQDSLARILDMSIGLVSAAGKLISLYNALPPLSEMKRYPKLHLSYQDFFRKITRTGSKSGKPAIIHDPLGLPVAVIQPGANVFIFLVGGFDNKQGTPQIPEDYGIPPAEAAGISKRIGKVSMDELKAKAASITAIYRQILTSSSENRELGQKMILLTAVEEISKLTVGLLHPNKFSLRQILDLVVNSLIILSDAEGAFIFICRRSVCDYFYRGQHQDFQQALGEKWGSAASEDPAFLQDWNGTETETDYGLKLHLSSFAKENLQACLGIINPQSENIQDTLEAFTRQANIVAEISLLYDLLQGQIGFLLNSVRHGIITANNEGKVMVLNRAGQSIFRPLGITLTVGQPLAGQGLPLTMETAVEQTISQGKAHFLQEDLIEISNQSYCLSWDVSPLKWENGDTAGAILVIEDITARRQSEKVLLQREQEFKALIENVPDIISRFDRDLRCVFLNSAIEKQYGLPHRRFLRKQIEELPIPEETTLLIKQTLLAGFSNGEEITINLEFAEKRQFHYFSAKFVPEFDENGTVKSILVIIRNITEIKMMENELIKAGTLDSISILAGGIAHDFNNFLATMLGNITLAKLYKNETEKIYEKMENIEAAILRAKELSQQLLIFAKESEPIKKAMDLKQLLIESTRFALSGSSISPEFSFAEEILPVEIDEGQINQVINNLVINAVQAMPLGGKIKIEARKTALKNQGKEHFLPLPDGEYVMFSISDEGFGIDSEDLSKIFEPFFSTKEKGSGLGLATSYSIIKKHHGHIDVQSEKNVGTTFSVYLPATNETELKKSEKETFIKGKGRVLLMDDEEAIRQASGELLSFLGYEVEFAEDGLEAVKLYRKAMAAGRPFNAVILDLTVPGGMGGMAAIEELLSMDPNVKAVVASGYANDLVLANYKDYGFKSIAVKPYKIEVLSRIMYELTAT